MAAAAKASFLLAAASHSSANFSMAGRTPCSDICWAVADIVIAKQSVRSGANNSERFIGHSPMRGRNIFPEKGPDQHIRDAIAALPV
jgi:hypothetical protein